jgi:hypothetical protein
MTRGFQIGIVMTMHGVMNDITAANVQNAGTT